MSNQDNSVPLLYSNDPTRILKGEIIASLKRGNAAYLLMCTSLVFFQIVSHLRNYNVNFVSVVPTIYIPIIFIFLIIGVIRATKKNARVSFTDNSLEIIEVDGSKRVIHFVEISTVFVYRTWINSHSWTSTSLWISIHFKIEGKVNLLDLGPKDEMFCDNFIKAIRSANPNLILEDYVNGLHRTKSYKFKVFKWW